MFYHLNPSLCRPEDLLLTHVPAPPVCIRPSVAVSAKIKNEDDLTMKLGEMVYFNHELQTVIDKGLGTAKLIEAWNMLQWTVA